MSVVIRLQNLPITAKSADIRNLFGGLRIPSGGVHIIGGEKGEAFIAFNSDEDARLAMRKNGWKIKDARVKLFLSSRLEMQYEVEKITKTSNRLLLSKVESSSDAHHKFPERVHESEKSSDTYRRSRSPTIEGGLRRSRSPRRRMQSHRSPSPSTREYFSRNEPLAPTGTSRDRDLNPSYPWENQFGESSKAGLSTSEIQAQLEKRIAEAIESNPILLSRYSGNVDNTYGSASESQSFPSNVALSPEMNYPLPQYPETSSLQSSDLHRKFPNDGSSSQVSGAYYVTLSGLDPFWDFHHVQNIVSASYLGPSDVCWELDSRGQRTGAAFVKLTNRNDFEAIIRRATFIAYDRLITVSECYPSLVDQYFPKASGHSLESERTENQNLCYSLKGLPFSVTQNDVVKFFSGFEVADVVIFYGPSGQATGLGYVSFTNQRDFKAAYSRNKEFIFNRFIQMFPCTSYEMAKAKESLKTTVGFTPNRTRRSLCALITGLPTFTSVKKLTAFFEESGFTADAIHITLNRRKCDGRAFIEFTNFRDFDLALKLNGTKFQDNLMICVKQILYDEMVKILEGQKAKHHYSNPEHPEPAFQDKAEKVPYLWEPPDTAEEQAKYSKKPLPFNSAEFSEKPLQFNSASGNASLTDRSHFSPVTGIQDSAVHRMDQPFFPPVNVDAGMQFPVQSFLLPQNDFNGNMPGTGQSFPSFQDTFNSPPKQNFNRNAFRSKHRVLSEIPLQQKTTSVMPEKSSVSKDARTESTKRDVVFLKDAEPPCKGSPRDPIKFNVNKSFGVSAKKNETFESEGSSEKKIKLSKLSPPKEMVQKVPNRKEKAPGVKKEAGQKQADERGKAPASKKETTLKPVNEKEKDPVTKKEIGDEKEKAHVVKKETALKLTAEKGKAPVGEKKNFQKDKAKFTSKFPPQNYYKKPFQQKRKRSISPFRCRSPSRSMPCVVQMSNVSLDVKTQDLVDFLYDFAYDPASIIRKYTDSGEPLGDVRVTFINRKEAELAIKSLQGCYLKSMQISMVAL